MLLLIYLGSLFTAVGGAPQYLQQGDIVRLCGMIKPVVLTPGLGGDDYFSCTIPADSIIEKILVDRVGGNHEEVRVPNTMVNRYRILGPLELKVYRGSGYYQITPLVQMSRQLIFLADVGDQCTAGARRDDEWTFLTSAYIKAGIDIFGLLLLDMYGHVLTLDPSSCNFTIPGSPGEVKVRDLQGQVRNLRRDLRYRICISPTMKPVNLVYELGSCTEAPILLRVVGEEPVEIVPVEPSDPRERPRRGSDPGTGTGGASVTAKATIFGKTGDEGKKPPVTSRRPEVRQSDGPVKAQFVTLTSDDESEEQRPSPPPSPTPPSTTTRHLRSGSIDRHTVTTTRSWSSGGRGGGNTIFFSYKVGGSRPQPGYPVQHNPFSHSPGSSGSGDRGREWIPLTTIILTILIEDHLPGAFHHHLHE